MRGLGATIAIAAALLVCPPETRAEAPVTSANDLAKKCISDNRSFCAGYISDAIMAFETDRKARGELPCLAGAAADEAVKTFTRAIVTKYAYSDLSAAAAIEKIYRETCGAEK